MYVAVELAMAVLALACKRPAPNAVLAMAISAAPPLCAIEDAPVLPWVKNVPFFEVEVMVIAPELAAASIPCGDMSVVILFARADATVEAVSASTAVYVSVVCPPGKAGSKPVILKVSPGLT